MVKNSRQEANDFFLVFPFLMSIFHRELNTVVSAKRASEPVKDKFSFFLMFDKKKKK